MTARTELLLAVADELLQHHPRGRVAIAIDGAVGAGASRFADELAIVIATAGRPVVRASIEAFPRPHSERLAGGDDSAQGFYRDAFGIERFRSELVEPFRRGDAYRVAIDGDVATAPSSSPDAVLLVDGLFLLRPELRGLWNAAARLEVRPGALPDHDGEGVERAAEAGEWHAGAAALYEREASPRRAAGIVIDMSDPDQPLRLYVDYC